MAVLIFPYLTKLKGCTPEDITEVALMVLLPVLTFHFLDGVVLRINK
ncbi:hypothetical protein [Thermococcus chitonophagus]|uniref:Uncharacterized protein n=1 Tax=Thermococcus chitonophagus TaxID=54262 RepID=A0A170SBU1_9EURY|nr:hypothetical protein [Thermococcus chitonophagus]CUX77088.1 hypothetical protein CHITON_0309 [Thermococcus chitonophagus]